MTTSTATLIRNGRIITASDDFETAKYVTTPPLPNCYVRERMGRFMPCGQVRAF